MRTSVRLTLHTPSGVVLWRRSVPSLRVLRARRRASWRRESGTDSHGCAVSSRRVSGRLPTIKSSAHSPAWWEEQCLRALSERTRALSSMPAVSSCGKIPGLPGAFTVREASVARRTRREHERVGAHPDARASLKQAHGVLHRLRSCAFLQMEFDVASEMSPFFLGIVTSRSRSAVCRHQHCTIYCTTAALEHGYRAATLGRAGLSDLFLRMRSGTRAHARTAEAPAALATSRQAAVADIVHGVIA